MQCHRTHLLGFGMCFLFVVFDTKFYFYRLLQTLRKLSSEPLDVNNINEPYTSVYNKGAFDVHVEVKQRTALIGDGVFRWCDDTRRNNAHDRVLRDVFTRHRTFLERHCGASRFHPRGPHHGVSRVATEHSKKRLHECRTCLWRTTSLALLRGHRHRPPPTLVAPFTARVDTDEEKALLFYRICVITQPNVPLYGISILLLFLDCIFLDFVFF